MRARLRRPHSRRWWVVAAAIALASTGLVVALSSGFHLVDLRSSGTAAPPVSGAMAGTPRQFGYLAAQHTNACSLQRSTVDAYPSDKLIEGSCCNAMDLTKYQYQVRELRRYAAIPEVPSDPYNIKAGLAKRLFSLDDSITLSGVDRRTFDSVMQMTEDKGPCCCHCWRWNATEGLDKFLITRHHMGAAEVAQITDLVNGCGGPMDASPAAAPGSHGST